MNTPVEMLEYVMQNNKESEFMVASFRHMSDYTIAEIADRKYVRKADGSYRLFSKAYGINVPIEDDDVLTGLINGLYVSTFISKKKNERQIHFLVHQYPERMKERFDENITKEVVQYMIIKNIIAFRLDTMCKIDDFIGGN